MATLYSSREVALARAASPAPKCGNELWPKADAHLPLRAYRGAIARLQPVVLTFRTSGRAGLRLSTSVSGLGHSRQIWRAGKIALCPLCFVSDGRLEKCGLS